MRPTRDNPYGILILALPFLVGGMILLFKNEPGIVVAYPAWRAPGYDVETASVTMEHVGGIFGLAVGGILVWFYFRVRHG